MEFGENKITYDSCLDRIEKENDMIDQMLDENMLHEVKFREFLSDVKGNIMPGEYFDGVFIDDIDYDGNKVVFITLTDNKYEALTDYEIKNIEPGGKGIMKMIIEYGKDIFFPFKDKEGTYYYQKFI